MTAFTRYASMFGFGFLVATSCSLDDGGEQSVATKNDLGIATLKTSSFAIDSEPVFELHAYDAAGTEVALLRRRIGFNAELPYVPGADWESQRGTTITLVVQGVEGHLVTRDVHLENLDGARTGGAADTFLDIPEVRATLAREANLTFAEPPPSSQPAPGEVDYWIPAKTCGAIQMRTPTTDVPYTEDCCQHNLSSWGKVTYHINPKLQDRVAIRTGHGQYACKMSDGSICDGDTCTYGPCGYAAPQFSFANSYELAAGKTFGYVYRIIYPDPTQNRCSRTFTAANTDNPDLGNTTGTCGYNWCVNGQPAIRCGTGRVIVPTGDTTGSPADTAYCAPAPDPWGY